MHPCRPPRSATLAACALLVLSLSLTAQVAPIGGHWVEQRQSSGPQDNPSTASEVVWQAAVVLDPSIPWVRLAFSDAHLDGESFIRVTSLLDGDTQTLNAIHLKQWQHSSAYFNGHVVSVELVAAPGSRQNRLSIAKVWAGDPPGLNYSAPETICGGNDNRTPTTNARVGRMLTAGLGSGCTGWLIDSPSTGNDRCHLTAGHCLEGNMAVLQFNVPASNSNCSLNHPSASDQYAINSSTWVWQNTGVGDDYGVFRCFPNSNTGLTTFQAQGATFSLATSMPSVGTNTRVTGFGTDGSSSNNASGANASCTTCSSPSGSRNQTLQTHTGDLAGLSGTIALYQVDTCGGNSGSPVIRQSNGIAYAIHTNGGCDDPVASTANAGTQVTAAGLQAAIATVCGGGGGGSNDECANAIQVFNGLNASATNAGATTSSPAWPCITAGADVWFFYQATCTGQLTIDTCTGSNFDTALELFSGVCGALSSLACNDDDCGLQSRVTATVQAGTIYLLRVGGFSGATGSFQLDISCSGSGGGSSITFDTEWKVQAKPDRSTGLPKIRATGLIPWVMDIGGNGGAFASGPIQNGTWWLLPRRKMGASISVQDIQRLIDDIYSGIATVTVLELVEDKTKLKVIDPNNGKADKLRYSASLKVRIGIDVFMKLKIKVKGLER